MTALPEQDLPPGHELFARYAFPPNELGYCGPAGTGASEIAGRADEFDGAWPYLRAIADAAGIADPLDADVVRNYWVGGPLLERVDPATLLSRLREVFTGQVTGLLDKVSAAPGVLAHHSFHVFVVYPWVRFLYRDPTTPLRILQDCRIRWGTVQSVDDEDAVVVSQPLHFDGAVLTVGDPVPERVRWRKNGVSLTSPPSSGNTVSMHWDWLCGILTDTDVAALAAATRATLDLVNATRRGG
jgi:Family of unknown function (DUF6390)